MITTTIDRDADILKLETEIAELREQLKCKREELHALRNGKPAPSRMHLVVYLFNKHVDLYLVFGKVDPYHYTRGEGNCLVFDLRTCDMSTNFYDAWMAGELESNAKQIHIEGKWKNNK